MEMLQELYYFPSSPVCRSVIMTAHQLGVQLNLKLVNLLASEQMDPDFVKMNPQHKVPLLCDQGFYLTESRAICIYLVQKYARNDSLYPNDVQQRATVDQRLHFDADIFFRRFAKLYDPVLLSEEVKQLDPEAEKDFQTAIGWLDIILQDHLYVAGDHLTIADLVLLTTAASAAAIDDHVFDTFANVSGWFYRCQMQISNYEELNGSGAALQAQIIRNAMS